METAKIMKTTAQWLEEVKFAPNKLNHWLHRQYIGEVLAASRIRQLADDCKNPKHKRVIEKIADDEDNHAEWVKQLLITRNIPIPIPTYENTRYWAPILGNEFSFEEVAGVGHHAETMRLSRIRAIAEDGEMDEDIREVFKRILPDETFHAQAFEAMSTPEAIEYTRKFHVAGTNVLGLEE